MREKPQNKRNVIIRLYRQFDLDLIYAFYKIKESNKNKKDKKDTTALQEWIVGILRAFVDGTYVPGRPSDTNDMLTRCDGQGKLILPRKQQFHIMLDETEDTDIINWLETITIGYRNAVIKGVIRGHIGRPCIYPCLETTDLYFKGTDYEPVVKLANDGLR